MSLLGRTSRDPPGSAHPAVEQWLRDAGTRLEPDPLFRRRLRSDVMNGWVAAREGLAHPPRRRTASRRMGRLGRACLYASVALCATVAGVMAAATQALPGDPLYAVKLRIEDLRVEVLPAQFQDEVAVNALGERIQEMERLAASGSAASALALAPVIERQYADVQRLLADHSNARSDLLGHRLAVVARLVESLPAELRVIVVGLMPGLPVANPVVDAHEPEPSPSGGHAAPAQAAPAADPPAAPEADPNPTPLTPASDGTDPGRRDERDGEDLDDEDGNDDEDDEDDKSDDDESDD